MCTGASGPAGKHEFPLKFPFNPVNDCCHCPFFCKHPWSIGWSTYMLPGQRGENSQRASYCTSFHLTHNLCVCVFFLSLSSLMNTGGVVYSYQATQVHKVKNAQRVNDTFFHLQHNPWVCDTFFLHPPSWKPMAVLCFLPGYTGPPGKSSKVYPAMLSA